jgi:hypothetical protein
MAIQEYLTWLPAASPPTLAEGAGKLVHAYLYGDLSEPEREDARRALTLLVDHSPPAVRRALAEGLASAENVAPLHGVHACQRQLRCRIDHFGALACAFRRGTCRLCCDSGWLRAIGYRPPAVGSRARLRRACRSWSLGVLDCARLQSGCRLNFQIARARSARRANDPDRAEAQARSRDPWQLKP